MISFLFNSWRYKNTPKRVANMRLCGSLLRFLGVFVSIGTAAPGLATAPPFTELPVLLSFFLLRLHPACVAVDFQALNQ